MSGESMKICLVTNLYPPLAFGGATGVAQIEAEELVKRGHKVTIFAGGNSYVKGCRIVNSTSHSLADIQKLAYDDYHAELSTSERANIGQILAVRNILTAKQYENEIDVFQIEESVLELKKTRSC